MSLPSPLNISSVEIKESPEEKPLTILTPAREAALQKREDDWHEVLILGSKAAIYFVFMTPVLALAANLLALFVLHSQQPVVEGLGNLFWICAGAFAGLITVAATLAQKRK